MLLVEHVEGGRLLELERLMDREGIVPDMFGSEEVRRDVPKEENEVGLKVYESAYTL